MGRKFRPAEGVPQEGESLRRRAARPDYKIDPETGTRRCEMSLERGTPHTPQPRVSALLRRGVHR